MVPAGRKPPGTPHGLRPKEITVCAPRCDDIRKLDSVFSFGIESFSPSSGRAEENHVHPVNPVKKTGRIVNPVGKKAACGLISKYVMRRFR